MVAFETLLLGIVTGIWPVRLMVAPPVAAVELRLDDAAVGALQAPPWEIACDFGPGPMPHRFTAIGRDASGREVARATQWVNIGRDRARLSALLERDAGARQPAAVRLAWETPKMVPPQSVTAALDGAALPVTDPHRIALPTVSLDQPHVVSVEAVFSPLIRERVDLAFGGDVVESVESELTAVAVILPPGRHSLELRDVQRVFSDGGRELTAVGVDNGRAEVALLVDQTAGAVVRPQDWKVRAASGRPGFGGDGPDEGFMLPQPPVDPTVPGFYQPPAGRLGAPDPGRFHRQRRPLTPDADRFDTLATVPSLLIDGDRTRTYYRKSEPRGLGELWSSAARLMLTPPPPARVQQRLADAVAMAASDVAASNHRRAVVLVLAEPPAGHGAAPGATDASTYEVAAVRAYLAALGVPLVVWSVTGSDPGPLTAAWGRAAAVANRWELQKQVKGLQKALAAQRIVWLAGRHLPQRIALDESKTELRLAR